MTAGQSSLTNNEGSATYTYVWKTDKAWAGTCRRLDVGLIDASHHEPTSNSDKPRLLNSDAGNVDTNSMTPRISRRPCHGRLGLLSWWMCLLSACTTILGLAGCGAGDARLDKVAAEPLLRALPGWQILWEAKAIGIDGIADVQAQWEAPLSPDRAQRAIERVYGATYPAETGVAPPPRANELLWKSRDGQTRIVLQFDGAVDSASTTVAVSLRRNND